MRLYAKYFEVLGLNPNASLSEIRRARNQMALKYHPDKNPDGVSIMKQINEAYEFLSKHYDNISNIPTNIPTTNDIPRRACAQTTDEIKQVFSTSQSSKNGLKTHKMNKPYKNFIVLVDELKNAMHNSQYANDTYITTFLSEFEILMNDKNNVVWFHHFRKNKGINMIHKLYMANARYNDDMNISTIFQKMFKFGEGLCY